jgi:maleate isomerase
MTDALGTRAVLAVLVPATNTMVEPDLASLQPPGVTNHTFRFPFPE